MLLLFCCCCFVVVVVVVVFIFSFFFLFCFVFYSENREICFCENREIFLCKNREIFLKDHEIFLKTVREIFLKTIRSSFLELCVSELTGHFAFLVLGSTTDQSVTLEQLGQVSYEPCFAYATKSRKTLTLSLPRKRHMMSLGGYFPFAHILLCGLLLESVSVSSHIEQMSRI